MNNSLYFLEKFTLKKNAIGSNTCLKGFQTVSEKKVHSRRSGSGDAFEFKTPVS